MHLRLLLVLSWWLAASANVANAPATTTNANATGAKQSEWERWFPSKQVRHDWCPKYSAAHPSKNSEFGAFVLSLYADKASEHATPCTDIQRVGGRGDGGKRICIDDLRPSDCIVYSLGSRLDFSFETNIARRFGCQVHTFDCTVGTPSASKIPASVSFYPWCVGGTDEIKPISSDLGHQGESGQYYTLKTIREKLGHSTIDLLKMDIERHEFAVVATLKDDSAPRQIVFETHLHNAYGMWGRPVSESEWGAMWSTLGGLGYGVFAAYPNPHCRCCCEFSVRRTTATAPHTNAAAESKHPRVLAEREPQRRYLPIVNLGLPKVGPNAKITTHVSLFNTAPPPSPPLPPLGQRTPSSSSPPPNSTPAHRNRVDPPPFTSFSNASGSNRTTGT